MEYILLCFIFFLFSIFFDFGFEIKPNNKNIAFYISLIILILFMGLRYRIGIDTNRYELIFYTSIPSIFDVENLLYLSKHIDPGFLIFESLIKTTLNDFVYVQLAQSAIVNTLILFYFRRHTKYVFTCIFFYFVWRYIPFTTEELRAALAISFTLYAFDFIIKKNYFQAILLAILAFSFHSSTIAMLPIFFLSWLKFNRFGIIFFAISLVAVSISYVLFNNFIQLLNFTDVLESHSSRYADSDLGAQVLNIKGIISLVFVYFWGAFIAIKELKKHEQNIDIMKYQAFIIFGLISVFATIFIGIFYRITRFLDIYFIILFAEYIGFKMDESILLTNKRPIIQHLYFIPFIFFAVFLYFTKINPNSDIRVLSRIYPYETVFTQELDNDREKLLKYYGVYFRNY